MKMFKIKVVVLCMDQYLHFFFVCVTNFFLIHVNADEDNLNRKRNHSISSAGDLLDNCLEEISSTSTSLSSSREPSPERIISTTSSKILTPTSAVIIGASNNSSMANIGRNVKQADGSSTN